MFFHITLSADVKLHPRYFGGGIKEILRNQLVEQVEGTCSGRFGFIICVTKILDDKDVKLEGILDPSSGYANYHVKYVAIVFRPFKGEVLDAIVTNACKEGFFAEAGPLQIFVSTHQMSDNYIFDAESNPPAYISADPQEGEERLTVDSIVRLKIVGTRLDATKIYAIGTIAGDCLGLLCS